MDIRTFTKRYFMASIKQDGILKALRKGIKARICDLYQRMQVRKLQQEKLESI